MKTIFQKSNEIDWNEVLKLLREEKTIKLYFSTKETFTICNVDGMLLTQNALDPEDSDSDSDNPALDVNAHYVSIYHPAFKITELKRIIEHFSLGSHLCNIIKIESLDFKVSLIDQVD